MCVGQIDFGWLDHVKNFRKIILGVLSFTLLFYNLSMVVNLSESQMCKITGIYKSPFHTCSRMAYNDSVLTEGVEQFGADYRENGPLRDLEITGLVHKQ